MYLSAPSSILTCSCDGVYSAHSHPRAERDAERSRYSARQNCYHVEGRPRLLLPLASSPSSIILGSLSLSCATSPSHSKMRFRMVFPANKNSAKNSQEKTRPPGKIEIVIAGWNSIDELGLFPSDLLTASDTELDNSTMKSIEIELATTDRSTQLSSTRALINQDQRFARPLFDRPHIVSRSTA